MRALGRIRMRFTVEQLRKMGYVLCDGEAMSRSHHGNNIAHSIHEKQPSKNKKRSRHREARKAKADEANRTRYALVVNCVIGDGRRRDGDGIINTILDCLQRAGIVSNDTIDDFPHIHAKFRRGKQWKTQIMMVPLSEKTYE